MTAVTLLKCAFFVYVSVKGMLTWKNNKRPQLLLAASAAVVIGVTAYKMLMSKELAPLVFL